MIVVALARADARISDRSVGGVSSTRSRRPDAAERSIRGVAGGYARRSRRPLVPAGALAQLVDLGAELLDGPSDRFVDRALRGGVGLDRAEHQAAPQALGRAGRDRGG